VVNDIVSKVHPNTDGYVISKEVEITCRWNEHPEFFEDVCRRIAASGIDVVDVDYEDIYRRKRGLDCEEENDNQSDVITKDLEKKYNDKIASGYKGLLESHGLARGVLLA